jgi:cytochrome c oxidase subunit II
MKKLAFLFALLFLAAMALAATKPAPAPTPTPLVLSGTLVNGLREIAVTAKKYEFIPDPIVVNMGEKVRLKITATDTDHGFGLDDFKIDQKLPKGATQIVEFTPDKTGAFVVRCTEFCGFGHMKMKSKFIVLPAAAKK